MATHTINLYPSSDITVNHTASSGDTRYSMINDETDDNGTTYIQQSLSSSNSSAVSSFECKPNSSDISSIQKIKIKNVSIVTVWGASGLHIKSINATLTNAVSLGDESFIFGTQKSITSASQNYISAEDTIASSLINNILNINDLTAKIQLTTSGRYTEN